MVPAAVLTAEAAPPPAPGLLPDDPLPVFAGGLLLLVLTLLAGILLGRRTRPESAPPPQPETAAGTFYATLRQTATPQNQATIPQVASVARPMNTQLSSSLTRSSDESTGMLMSEDQPEPTEDTGIVPPQVEQTGLISEAMLEQFGGSGQSTTINIAGWLRSFDYPGLDITLRQGRIMIGAHPRCDLVIRDDDAIENYHVRVEIGPDKVVLYNLATASTPQVNDSRVSVSRDLKHRDIIRLTEKTQLTFIQYSVDQDTDT